MKLCDDCITILKNDLSEEAIAILNKIELFNELSERDLVRKLSLNHKHLKKLLYNLELKLFLTYESYGRTKAYHLTENGSRLLRLEENDTEIDTNFTTKADKEVPTDESNNHSQTTDDMQSNSNTEAEVTKEDEEKLKEVKKEDSKKENSNDEPKNNIESSSDEAEEDDTNTGEKETNESSSEKSENLVWKFK